MRPQAKKVAKRLMEEDDDDQDGEVSSASSSLPVRSQVDAIHEAIFAGGVFRSAGIDDP